jgi:YidC/Oxa1 family membrane protein insertase
MPVFANIIEEAFSPLIKLFETIMVFIHAHLVGGSWGLAIVGLTVLTRAVLVPVTYKQLKSMQELQRHAPEMQRIKERYKEDKQRQQQEIMKFYQENKINPLASCLPFALQLPVFISLFYMLRTDLKRHICGPALISHYNSLHHTAYTAVSQLPSKYVEQTGCQSVDPGSGKFLFIPDITTKATGVVLITLILVYIASQVTSTLMATATADPNQRRMMLLLPLVIVAFLFRYPAGLLVYWITTNLWTIGQQYFIRRRMGPASVMPGKGSGGGDSSSPNGKPVSQRGAGSPKSQPALAGVGGSPSAGPPPPPPRRKKKRSGRRR